MGHDTTTADKTAVAEPTESHGAPISPRALADVPAIVTRYQQGESLQVIAKESAVSVRTIYRWMLSELGDKYEGVVTDVLIDRIADADVALDSAADTCRVARAREQARFARMDFERRRPKLYGQKQEITTDKTIRVVIQRDGNVQGSQAGPVIDATALSTDR